MIRHDDYNPYFVSATSSNRYARPGKGLFQTKSIFAGLSESLPSTLTGNSPISRLVSSSPASSHDTESVLPTMVGYSYLRDHGHIMNHLRSFHRQKSKHHQRSQQRAETSSTDEILLRGGGGSIRRSSSVHRQRNNIPTSLNDFEDIEVEKKAASLSSTTLSNDEVNTTDLNLKGRMTISSRIQVSSKDVTTSDQQRSKISLPSKKTVNKGRNKRPFRVVKRSSKERIKKPSKLKQQATKYVKSLKNRNHTNLRRKVMHALFGMGFSVMNHIIPRTIFLPGMIILSIATLIMELLRYDPKYDWMNDTLHTVLGSSLRKHEMDGKFTGSFYYFLGVTLSALLYDKNAATLGIIQLAIADPSASYFGRRTRHVYWSRIENGLYGIGRNKGLLGFLGGAVACFPINYRILSTAKYVIPQKALSSAAVVQAGSSLLPGGQMGIIFASFMLGLAGSFADLCVPTPALTLPKKVWGIGPLPPLHVDDNFVVPIVSAYACTKIFQALHWTATSGGGAIQLSKFLII